MAAYPFHPLSNERLKDLPKIIKEFKHNVDTQRLRKDYDLSDRIISKIIHSASDQTCNNPQIKNP